MQLLGYAVVFIWLALTFFVLAMSFIRLFGFFHVQRGLQLGAASVTNLLVAQHARELPWLMYGVCFLLLYLAWEEAMHLLLRSKP
jgi:hypothetical protein